MNEFGNTKRGIRRTQENCYSSPFTIELILTSLGSNPRLRSERSAINYLSHGMAAGGVQSSGGRYRSLRYCILRGPRAHSASYSIGIGDHYSIANGPLGEAVYSFAFSALGYRMYLRISPVQRSS